MTHPVPQLGPAARARLARLARRVRTEDHGAVTVIVAFAMVVILGMAALVVDIGGAEVRKAQLQDAADAAATAIAQQCYDAAGTTVNACDSGVIAAASATALRYAAAALPGTSVTVTAVTWTISTVAVSLASQQTSTFAKIFNVDSTNIQASATAQWGLPATPLPLAYNECSMPAPSATTKQFLRYDLLDLNLGSCGLIGGVTDVLGPGWMSTTNCTWQVNLTTYIIDVLTKVLPTVCASTVSTLVGKYVLLPVYNHVLTSIIVNGVLLGQGYQIQKYALFQVTGYDFQTLTVNLGVVTASVGPANISGSPQCPAILGIKIPTCQGLQGYFQDYLTPAQAAQRLRGVQLVG